MPSEMRQLRSLEDENILLKKILFSRPSTSIDNAFTKAFKSEPRGEYLGP